MNKNLILNIIFGIVGGALVVFMCYLIISTKMQANQNTIDIQTIGNFINSQIKQSSPAPAK